MRSEAELIAQAVEGVLHDGYRTRDLGTGAGTKMVGCKAMGRLVREKLEGDARPEMAVAPGREPRSRLSAPPARSASK